MPRKRESIPFIEEFERMKAEQRPPARSRPLKKDKRLFQYLMLKYNLPTDVQLADFIGTVPSMISTIRNDKAPFSPRLLLSVYDKTDLSVEDIRAMAREDLEVE